MAATPDPVGGANIDLGTVNVDISALVSISATDASADETGSDAGQFTVDLGAVNDTGSAITFDLTDAAIGTATSGTDYTAFGGAGVISIADDASTGQLVVVVTDDALAEGTESFNATLSNASDAGVTITGANETANITDNDDSNPEDDGGTATDPNPIIEGPVTDEDEDSDVESPTYEAPGEGPLTEGEVVSPVQAFQTPQDSGDADESIVEIKDLQDEETQEIIYLTDEIDMNTQSEERDDDRAYIYYDNVLYKNISFSKYLNLSQYAAENAQVAVSLDDISILDFDIDDTDPVGANDDYDALRQEIDESFNTELKGQAIKAKIVTVTAATFTVGIVSYLLRAGSLVASMMSALPLWRGFDPIAIFSGDKKKKKKQDDISDTDESKPETLFDGEPE